MRRAHYVLSTHWDREWYQTFQDYRFRLVHLLDPVFDGLADDRLRGPFQCDGQAIILEDYLEVRPERREQVLALARAGKLAIGPWYVLPDEFIVSGESLVRNLRYGRELARSWGARPSDAGFVCDIFGHNSQLPQILAGFGIPAGFIWRGLNTIETRHVLWRGADGTTLPCYRFGHGGYCSFAFAVRHANQHEHAFDPAKCARDLDDLIAFEAEHTEIDPVLLFDGGDHQEWDQQVYGVLAQRMSTPADEDVGGTGDARADEGVGDATSRPAGEGWELVHSSLDEYLAEMLPQMSRITTIVEGELREPGRLPRAIDQQWLIPGVLSSRVDIKQANAHCQTLLCQWAEPWAACASAALGLPFPQGYLNVAWRWLLQNHPHDSICGCSIDAVHEDMRYRFHQCEGIAERLTSDAQRKIAASVAGDLSADVVRLVVFNPLARPHDEVADLTLEIPTTWPTFNEFFGFEPKPAFRIYDAAGQELPYQRLGQAMNRSRLRVKRVQFPQGYKVHEVRVAVRLAIPALGYATLTLRAAEPENPDSIVSPKTLGVPTRYLATAAKGVGAACGVRAVSERCIANELLTLTVEPNGSLTIIDGRTGQAYSRLLTFEDSADIGDGWYHGEAINDETYSSTASASDVALVQQGPLLATLRVRTTLRVPAEFDSVSMRRSEERVELLLDSLMTLRAGADRVEVETHLHNVAGDHRLRVLFPSGAVTDTYLADSPFDVVERPIALRADNALYREPEVETRPQQTWTAVHDAHRGLAIIGSGLMESAVRDLPERPIALTLLRATRRTVLTDGEPGGQLNQSLAFRYWIVPLGGAPDRTRLCNLGVQLAAGLRAVHIAAEDLALDRQQVELPPNAGFLRVEGDAVLSSAGTVGSGLEVRLFNPTTHPSLATLDLSGRPISAPSLSTWQRVNLEGAPLPGPKGAALAIADARLVVALKPKEIVTLRLA